MCNEKQSIVKVSQLSQPAWGREYGADIHSLCSFLIPHTRVATGARQTYGKGKAADCRRHVQKLNMLRAEKEQRGIEELQNSHPPEHYADTFTAQERQVEEIVRPK